MSLRIRGGQLSWEPPPEVPTYGPTLGAQWVRDHAVPGVVTDPGNGIACTSRADFVSKLAANPSGSTFVFAGSTTYPWTSVVQTGTKAPRVYFLPEAIIDGQNESATAHVAFDGSDITIKGGKFRNFRGGADLYSNCIIEDAEFTECYNNGLGILGSNTRLTRVWLHGCGQYGFAATRPGSTGRMTDNIIEYCQIEDNNYRLLDPADNAGGCKMLYQDGLIARYNWSHDNYGCGLWWDADNQNILCEENVCENNTRSGIFYEISNGGTTIQRNAVLNNVLNEADFGNASLLVSSSDAREGTPDNNAILVTRNIVDGDGSQVLMGIVSHTVHQPHVSYGNHFYENAVYLRGTGTGRVGAAQSVGGSPSIFVGRDNLFESNAYHVADTAIAKWQWQGSTRTWDQWRAYGHDDPTGSLTEDL